jgi:homoserine kinase type II
VQQAGGGVANYSAIDEAARIQLAHAYGADFIALTPLPDGMANSSFRCETDRGPMVVSVLDNHDQLSATRLVRTSEWMRAHGIPTNEIVRRLDGGLLSTLGDTPVVVRRWLPGSTANELAVDRLSEAGRLLAQIHRCRPDALDVPWGNRRLSAPLRALLDEFPDQAHAAWIRRRLAKLDQHFPLADDPRRPLWVPVHGDFHPTNLVVSGDGGLSVVDWETAAIDEPMLDLGLAVLGLCRAGDRLDPGRLREFLDGYVRAGAPLCSVLLGPATEYAAVILSFHRYRRHHMRYPNDAQRAYFREMVSFVEHTYPAV